MSSSAAEPEPGDHLEFLVAAQIARARPWEPAGEPVLDDLTDAEEADFLQALRC